MYIYLLCPIGKHSWLSALLQIWNCAMIYGLCRSTFLTALFSRPSSGRIVWGSNSKEIAFQNGILFPGTCITMYFFRHLTALSWAIWKELRQLDLFKSWMAYPICSFQANSVQNLSFKNRIWLYWLCVYFLSIVCTCRTLGAIKEKNIIVWYFSFFTVILFFFFYQRLTSSHSLPQDKALQIYNYETDQFITNGWVQTNCLVQRILVLNMCLLLSNEFKKKKISEYWRRTKISFISENLSPIYQMVSEKFSLKNRKFCTENRMYSSLTFLPQQFCREPIWEF